MKVEAISRELDLDKEIVQLVALLSDYPMEIIRDDKVKIKVYSAIKV